MGEDKRTLVDFTVESRVNLQFSSDTKKFLLSKKANLVLRNINYDDSV